MLEYAYGSRQGFYAMRVKLDPLWCPVMILTVAQFLISAGAALLVPAAGAGPLRTAGETLRLVVAFPYTLVTRQLQPVLERSFLSGFPGAPAAVSGFAIALLSLLISLLIWWPVYRWRSARRRR
jgi:hypothetical protein